MLLYISAVVMTWPLTEHPQNSPVWEYIFQKPLLWPVYIHNVRFEVITEPNTLDAACLQALPACPFIPSQLLPNNLVTNNIFLVQKKCWKKDCCSRYGVYRNRHPEIPEGSWMADLGAAQLGWQTETPNMQPLTPMTSYMRSNSESYRMYCWLLPADLWHKHIRVFNIDRSGVGR
jgi:hypothetical protein